MTNKILPQISTKVLTLEPINITVVYRARRFWYTPIIDQSVDKILDHFGGRENVPTEFITEFAQGVRDRNPDGHAWKVYYEPCPVTAITSKYVTCTSEDMPSEIKERFPSFYAGGKFNVDKSQLLKDGKAYHSRHGEYFYLEKPQDGFPLLEGVN